VRQTWSSWPLEVSCSFGLAPSCPRQLIEGNDPNHILHSPAVKMRLPFLPFLSLAPLIALLPSLATATPEEAAPFLKEANTFLLAGSFKDAARAFTEALGELPSLITLALLTRGIDACASGGV
jgi:hypothetical protein